MNVYSSDFETTTEAVCDKESWVWLWACNDINNIETTHYGNSIKTFIDFCIREKQSKHYFHNLKFDGIFIIDYLFRKLGYRCLNPDEKPQVKTFRCLINNMNVFYMIEIYFDYDKSSKQWIKTSIYDSLKILPFSVEKIANDFGLPINKLSLDYDLYRSKNHTPTKEEIDYITHDVKIVSMALKSLFDVGDVKMTASGNALANFKSTLTDSKSKKYIEKKYRRLYPVLDKEIDDDIRKAYRGGYVYVNPNYQGKVLVNLLVYDKNSMYSSHMRHQWLPYGKPKFFEGEYEGNSRFYIQHLFARFKVKPGMVPTIQVKKGAYFNGTEYITDSTIDKKGKPIDEMIELFLSNLDLELFKSHYDILDIEYINGWDFKTNKGVFNEFIDTNYKIKCTSKGAVKQSSKLRMNSSYGKFASSTDVTGKVVKFEYSDKYNTETVKFDVPRDENGEPYKLYKDAEYTALGVAITAYARYDLITKIDKLGGIAKDSSFVYSDTDSLHILDKGQDLSFIPIDDIKLNYWKNESVVTKAKFLRAKTYVEEIKVKNGVELNVKCAGMPKNIKKQVTFDNFKIGFKSGNKLKPQIVPGGVLLIDTPFEIKEKGVL